MDNQMVTSEIREQFNVCFVQNKKKNFSQAFINYSLISGVNHLISY